MKKHVLVHCGLIGGLFLLAGALMPLHAQEETAPASALRGGRAAAVPAPVEGPTARFSATVYELHMPADQIGRLDIDALTNAAASAQAFDKALAALGTAHASYVVDQSVQLAKDSIRIGASTPYITNSQVTNEGAVINSVAYTNIGAIFSLSGKVKSPGQVDLNLNVQVAAISDGGVPISSKTIAPAFRAAQMARKGPVQTGQPFVLVSADGASPDADGKAIVVVARMTLGTPE